MPVRVTSPWRDTPGTARFDALDAAGAPIPGRCVAIVGLTHGNEIVGEAVLSRLEAAAEAQLCAGSLVLIRANLEAQALNRRHTPEGSDLNRLWGPEALARLARRPRASLCYEERRALELAALLGETDAILDLHSTSRPSPPFLVFRDDQLHASIAVKLGVKWLVTGLHERAILDGGMCPDVGLAPGERSERIGLTFESGQHLDPANLDRAWLVAARFLHHLGVWRHADPAASDVRPHVYEIVDRLQQVPAGSEPYRFVGYIGGEAGGGRKGPPRTLASFDEIEADEVILRRGRSTVVRAHAPFTMLLPTPAADPGTDLYYVAQRRPAVRGALRTREEARLEALGIERMLDLIDEDDYARGTTRASFDARQVLDLCADAVGGALRLPADHPHRRVTVVGRGDWGGDEGEQRIGQRFRAAMRRAMAEGVPVERVQLLRGASLGWFRVLTSRSMGELLDRRRARMGEAGGMRLWLSARQPDTVSVLIVGDLERALREADYRHVRVGLVVEAATVEPDGDWARVRVSRAALFSARPEILHATLRLVAGLADEHRFLVQQPPLADDPAIVALLDPDGAIRPTADPASLAALRQGLCRLQLRLWREALRDVIQPRLLANDAAIGEWLAQTMSATGILDAASLRALLVHTDATGHTWADPSRLDALFAPGGSLRLAGIAPVASRGRASPPQPLVADDVDADDLERWIGWKRLLRLSQIIPDTRGKDLDLAFDERGITDRAASYFRRARELAEQIPGRVMVVVAGDGLNPGRERPTGAASLLDAHHEALRDANLRYLRIQHAQGTHLSWLKDVIQTLRDRPDGSAPVGLQWEGAHGASVNVLLVCVRDLGVPESPWSLDGWSVERCSVLISELRGTGVRDYRVGLFTEPLGPTRQVNQDLLHFGRAHCENLLAQGGARVFGAGGRPPVEDLDRVVVAQIAGWIDRVRAWRQLTSPFPVPEEPEARARWVAGQLGLSDAALARALAEEADGGRSPSEAAVAIWNAVEPWRGSPVIEARPG